MSILMAIAALLASQDSNSADKWPKLTEIDGPSTYCGWAIALDIEEGEKLTVQDPGIDFMVYYVNGGREFGVYEGQFPQGKDREPVDAGLGIPTWRLKEAGTIDGVSYQIRSFKNVSGFETYAHIWSRDFDGTDADFELIRSIRYGRPEETGCSEKN